MPRYFKQNGDKVPNIRLEKAWIIIPIKSNKNTTPKNTETYLVQPRVADYIVLLESKIKGALPKLPINVK
jgi:hypothetical protein